MCPPYARLQLYSLVFRLLQKPANVRVESRIVNGSEFQSEEPEVAKLRDRMTKLLSVSEENILAYIVHCSLVMQNVKHSHVVLNFREAAN